MSRVFLDIWGTDYLDDAIKEEGYTKEDLENNFVNYIVHLDHGNGVTLYKDYEGSLKDKDAEWVRHDLHEELNGKDYLKVLEAFSEANLIELTLAEKAMIAFEKADLEQLATEMVDSCGDFADGVLVFDEEEFFVIAESPSTHTPSLHYICRMKQGWNDNVETDEVLSEFMEDVPIERYDEIYQKLEKAYEEDRHDGYSRVMLEETGHDYWYYERRRSIDITREWIWTEIKEFIERTKAGMTEE